MKIALFSLLIALPLVFSCKHVLIENGCQAELKEGLKSDKSCSTTPLTEPYEIFKVVEEQPLYPGCDSITNSAERKLCADEKMLAFIYENLDYPPEALSEMLEGVVVIKFVVENDGCIAGIEIVRDIGCDCDKEALRIVELMPHWNPGKQRGNPVRVQYNLPIHFEL